jgi:hypothetical protein
MGGIPRLLVPRFRDDSLDHPNTDSARGTGSRLIEQLSRQNTTKHPRLADSLRGHAKLLRNLSIGAVLLTSQHNRARRASACEVLCRRIHSTI